MKMGENTTAEVRLFITPEEKNITEVIAYIRQFRTLCEHRVFSVTYWGVF